MPLSWKSLDGFVIAVALSISGCLCRVAVATEDAPNERSADMRYNIDSAVAPARQHASDLRLLTGYEADVGDCGDLTLGPLKGEYSGKEAWRALIAPVCTLVPDGPSANAQMFADMSHCQCSFGFPRLQRFAHEPVLVIGSKLAGLKEAIPAPLLVIDQELIDDSGAASVPDLLRYLSASAFHWGRGYRAAGAQYPELRGLGARYTLVLINGRRAPGSASDLTTNAFDLSSIPISAIERIEISTDASSLIHGMDAIGGIVNLVLKSTTERDMRLRYGAARGGGSQGQLALGDGLEGERGQFVMFLDVQKSSELLGRERDRWNDQDFSRFGGRDQRVPFGSPFNVRSMTGEPLPGTSSPTAAAQFNSATGTFDFLAGQRSQTSIRSFQAIEPEGSQATVIANGSLKVGRSVASLEMLAARRENELQLMPSFLPGNILGASHPGNSFGVPVLIDGVLAGLPKQREHYETTSYRGVLAMDGPIGAWDYSAFLARSIDDAEGQLLNVLNPAALNLALRPTDASQVLSLVSTVHPTSVPDQLLVDAPKERYHTGTMHLHASVQGRLASIKAHLGVEHRHEQLDFNRELKGACRDITSAFAHLRIPLIGPAQHAPMAQNLELLLGIRGDRYSDIGTVTKTQVGFTWQPVTSLRIQGAYNESFRAPSLVELSLPPTTARTPLLDPSRQEVSVVEIVTGGNPSLRPTTGHTKSVGVTWQPTPEVRVSAEYWRVKLQHHVSLLAPMTLLAHEDDALEDRIFRADRSAEDRALSRQGQLMKLDISRANVGGAAAAGVDVGAEAKITTGLGTFTPRLQVTFTNAFSYGELPIMQLQLEDRVGIASEFGTIPGRRAVASLTYARDVWRSALFAHMTSRYRDREPTTGVPMQRRISGAPVWDLNLSRMFGNLRVTMGATNITDREPPFVHAGGSVGFDLSQSDLEGRVVYGMISGSF